VDQKAFRVNIIYREQNLFRQ